MSKKIKTCLLTVMAAMLLLFLCVGSAFAYADDNVPEPAGAELVTEEPPASDDFTASFIAYLKDKYGADYEFYYEKIIERWGSVEAYLLSFGEQLPEEQKNSWEIFVGWLRENSPVWATPLAVIIVIIVCVVGKKKFDEIVERIVNSKLTPVIKELNAQSKATVSIIHSQQALLGTGERFKDNVEELKASEKELTDG